MAQTIKTIDPEVELQNLISQNAGILSRDIYKKAVSYAASHFSPEILFKTATGSKDAKIRNICLDAIKKQGIKAVPILRKLLSSKNERSVLFAVQILSEFRDKESISLIAPLIEHKNLNIAQAAASALGKIGDPKGIDALIRGLEGDEWVRAAAAESLGRIRDKRSEKILIKLLKDESLCDIAASSLSKIGGIDSLTPLTESFLNLRYKSSTDRVLLALATIIERHPRRSAGILKKKFPRYSLVRKKIHKIIKEKLSIPCSDEVNNSDIEDDRNPSYAESVLAASSVVAVVMGFSDLLDLIFKKISNTRSKNIIFRIITDINNPEINLKLKELLHHNDISVKTNALNCFCPTHIDLPLLGEIFRSSPYSCIRSAACLCIAKVSVAEAVQYAENMLYSDNAEERKTAVQVLSMCRNKKLLTEIIAPCLKPKIENYIKKCAIEVIKKSGVSDINRILLNTAMSGYEDKTIRINALRAIHPDNSIANTLVDIALNKENKAFIRIEALYKLKEYNHKKLINIIKSLLKEDGEIRLHAIKIGGKTGAKEIFRELYFIYKNASQAEKLEIISSAPFVRTEEALLLLEKALEDENSDIRRAAAASLASMPELVDENIFIKLAGDKDWYIRTSALGGLKKFKTSEKALSVIEQLTTDEEDMVADTASKILAEARA